MKNLMILSAFILLPVLAKAQFKAGQIFFQGGANFSLNDTKYPRSDGYSDRRFGNYNHNLSYSSGYFTGDTRAIGWTLGQSLSLVKSGNVQGITLAPRTLQSISFSAGRFVEHYKSLSDKFALYIRPGFGLTYQLKNEINQQDALSYANLQTNTFTLGINVGAGVAWRVSPKWALYGGVAFANPINVSVGWNNSENISTNNLGGQPRNTKGSFFNYNLSPSLYSGSINLGFRYIVTRGTSY